MGPTLAERDRLKVAKVRQLGDRWEAGYQYLETVLGELKTRLESDPINNVELLYVKSSLHEEVKAHLNWSATLVDSMFVEDLEQTVITRKAQGARRTQAESKVHACEELVAKMQAANNAKHAAIVEAAAAAAAVAEVAEAPAAKEMEEQAKEAALKEVLAKETALKEEQEMKAARTIQLAWRRYSAL